jgi:hypothetical protein
MPKVGMAIICGGALFLNACEKNSISPGPLGSIVESHLEGARDGACSRVSSKHSVDSIAFYDCNWQVGDTAILVNTTSTGIVRRLTRVWRIQPSHFKNDFYKTEVSVAKELGTTGSRCSQPGGETLVHWQRSEFEVQLMGTTEGRISVIYHLGHPAPLANCES